MSTADRPREVSYWLQPAQPELGELQTTIDSLARRFGVASFGAHVTLHLATLEPGESPSEILSAVARQTPVIEAVAADTGHTEAFFKTLFIGMADPAITALAGRLRAAHRAPSDYRLDAHLSLLYAHLPAAERAALAAGQQWRGRRIRFDRILCVVPGPTGTYEDVAGWRMEAHATLGGGSQQPD